MHLLRTKARSKRVRRCIPRKGAAMVEFAVALPVILLCMLSMIEISRVMLLQHSADTAAYEGARSAMVPGAKSSEGVAAAQALLDAAGLRNTVVTCSPDTITEDTSLITVRVEIPISNNAWIAPKWIMRNSVISQVSLVCERPPVTQLTAIPSLKTISASFLNVSLSTSGSSNSGSGSNGNGNGNGNSGSGNSKSGSSASVSVSSKIVAGQASITSSASAQAAAAPASSSSISSFSNFAVAPATASVPAAMGSGPAAMAPSISGASGASAPPTPFFSGGL